MISASPLLPNLETPCHLVTERGREAGSLLQAIDTGAWLIVRDVPFTIEVDAEAEKGSVRAAIFDGISLRSELPDAAMADAVLCILAGRALEHAHAARASTAGSAIPASAIRGEYGSVETG